MKIRKSFGQYMLEVNITFRREVNGYAALLANGWKIKAIKLYREINGTSLRESKDYIDAMEEHLGLPLFRDWFAWNMYSCDGLTSLSFVQQNTLFGTLEKIDPALILKVAAKIKHNSAKAPMLMYKYFREYSADFIKMDHVP